MFPSQTETAMTVLLNAVSGGEPGANDRLYALVYEELHRLAGRHMADERSARTLQTTALVHEAYFKLAGGQWGTFANRRHFFAAAGKCMRQILVDDARRRGRIKRGGGLVRQPLNGDPLVEADGSADLLALEDAMKSLEARDPRLVEVVHLRYFAGLTIDETAEALGLSPRKVVQAWQMARAFLHRTLSG